MAREFTMPKLGLTMTDGTIQSWLVADGAVVEIGDPVLVIETDKVETEVEARESGILQLTAEIGENYECGAVIAYLLDEGEAPVSGSSSAGAPAATPAPPVAPVATIPAQQTDPQPTLVADQPADVATRGEHGRVLASPRARATARERGVNLAQIAGTGPGGRIVHDDVVSFTPPAAAAAATAMPAADVATRGEHGRVLASPRARATARERGVDLVHVAGTGPGGRIVHDDVVAAASKPAPAAAATIPPLPAAGAPARPDGGLQAAGTVVLASGGARLLAELLGVDLAVVPAAAPDGRVSREDVAAWVRSRLSGAPEVVAVAGEPAPPQATVAPLIQEPTNLVPLRGMRGIIAERMHASLAEMAQLTLSVDADLTAVIEERERRRSIGESVPGFTAWVVAAAGRALVEHPYVNSQVTPDGVAWLPEVNVGVAVALDDGLIVPVVHRADSANVGVLHDSIADLAARARSGKLALDELQGGTFSVTALGMYGVDMFTPVINPPNTAILGVGRVRQETVWSGSFPSPRSVITLSLTWDHRAFDGAPAAQFAQRIVQLLAEPDQL